ncbi:type VII secretion target [Kitasatospora herbaricolor]|uniref:type VII secretion target n=1 Tax=Kitasatospora herbaricolor TaxID=68217 RepID=UPI0036DA3D05
MTGYVRVDPESLVTLGQRLRELGEDISTSTERSLGGMSSIGDSYGNLPVASEAAQHHDLSVEEFGNALRDLRRRCAAHAEDVLTAAARYNEADARAADDVASLRRRL